jgi:hypothetical protein
MWTAITIVFGCVWEVLKQCDLKAERPSAHTVTKWIRSEFRAWKKACFFFPWRGV